MFERDAELHIVNVQVGECVDRHFLGECPLGRPVFASWAENVFKG